MLSSINLQLVELPPEDEQLRPSVRAFANQVLVNKTLEQRARSWLGFDAEFSRELGARGWLGLSLPKRYGGQERSPFARFVMVEELLAIGAPVAAHWVADRQSAPLILRYGTEAQRQFYLPRICRGEAFFCIGMSEPNSGSDLASVRTTATKTANGWLLNGQKIWTTYVTKAHYMIALVRTSGTSEDRHKGLSQILIDLSAPGIQRRPIIDVTGDAHFGEVFFDNVELPEDALIGEEGAGWAQVTAELAFERSGPERIYSSMVLLDAAIEQLRASTHRNSAIFPLIGKLVGELAVLRSLSIAVTAQLVNGENPALAASLVKDMGTELEQSIPALLTDLFGAMPDLAIEPKLYRTLQYISQISPSFSLRGGTREILRGIIARGLGIRAGA